MLYTVASGMCQRGFKADCPQYGNYPETGFRSGRRSDVRVLINEPTGHVGNGMKLSGNPANQELGRLTGRKSLSGGRRCRAVL